MRRALAIDEKSFGASHPNVARDLNNLATLLQATNRLAEAEALMRRALAIDKQSFGPDHPKVARALNNLAGLLQATNRLSDAEPLMRRALAIYEKSFGPDHPKVAIGLNNLAALLQATNRLSDAEPLMRRALAIDEKSLGPNHPDVVLRLNNLATLLEDQGRWLEAAALRRKAKPVMTGAHAGGGPAKAVLAQNAVHLRAYARARTQLCRSVPRCLKASFMASRRTACWRAPRPNTRFSTPVIVKMCSMGWAKPSALNEGMSGLKGRPSLRTS